MFPSKVILIALVAFIGRSSCNSCIALEQQQRESRRVKTYNKSVGKKKGRRSSAGGRPLAPNVRTRDGGENNGMAKRISVANAYDPLRTIDTQSSYSVEAYRPVSKSPSGMVIGDQDQLPRERNSNYGGGDVDPDEGDRETGGTGGADDGDAFPGAEGRDTDPGSNADEEGDTGTENDVGAEVKEKSISSKDSNKLKMSKSKSKSKTSSSVPVVTAPESITVTPSKSSKSPKSTKSTKSSRRQTY